jgi:hypothetical protein
MHKHTDPASAAAELLKRRLIRNSLTEWARHKGFEPAPHHQLFISQTCRVTGPSHRRAASILSIYARPVGMKGFYAGSRGIWRSDNAEYNPEHDGRASTRDRNNTAQQGERALQTPYDDPRGTPKSWTNPADAEPDNEDGIKRLGKRVIEEGVIEPCEEED